MSEPEPQTRPEQAILVEEVLVTDGVPEEGSEPTVVLDVAQWDAEPAAEPPPSNLVLALVGLLLFWPLGIPALVQAARVNPQWSAGEEDAAREASERARRWGTRAVGAGVGVLVLWLVYRGLGSVIG